MTQGKRKRVAIYCRVSTGDQDTDRQEQDLRAWAERCDYEVVSVEHETASGAKDSRPVRQKIMTLARGHLIDAVLVTELSRWGRSTSDLLNTVNQLAHHKVSLLTAQGMDFDLSSPQGKLIFTLLSGISEFERELIAERTRSGLAAARARGKKLGRQAGDSPVQDRYRDEIKSLRDSGVTIREIAHRMRISTTTVQRVLKAH